MRRSTACQRRKAVDKYHTMIRVKNQNTTISGVERVRDHRQKSLSEWVGIELRPH
jgi:hypothetical protein